MSGCATTSPQQNEAIVVSGVTGAIVVGGLGAAASDRGERGEGILIGAVAGVMLGVATGHVLIAGDAPFEPSPVPYTPLPPPTEPPPAVVPPAALTEPVPTPSETLLPAGERFTPTAEYHGDLGWIRFDFDRATIRREFHGLLDAAARYLREHPEVVLTIEGHADAVGTAEYNLSLSEQRAIAVKRYLVSKGISAERLRIVGKGEGEPAVPNRTPDGKDDPDGRSQNRRAVFIPR
jgi:OOP family OmpA-OmpF porin